MEDNKKKHSVISRVKGFMDTISKDHVTAYAAKASYFLIMSFIPFILFLTTMIRYTPVSYNMVRQALIEILPENLKSFVLGIVVDVYRRNTAVIPISGVTAIWSAGKGLQAITDGLNTIYKVKETRNWLVTRIYSVFYTMLFSIAIIMSLTLMVLGRQIQIVVNEYSPLLGKMSSGFMSNRNPLMFLILFLVFLILFKFLPNRKATFRSQVPGALLTTIGWMIFSLFYSLYFTLYPGFSNMYGSLTTLIIAMLWIYFLMNFMLFGAEINFYFEKEFRRLAAYLREQKEIQKKEKEEERIQKEEERIRKEERRKERRERRLKKKKDKEIGRIENEQNMNIYILRHGITEWNKLTKVQGSADIPLAQEGIDLAKATGEALQEIHFDICFTSPLIRAVQTEELVLGSRTVPVIKDARLAEIDFGELEGVVIKNDKGEMINEKMKIFFEHPVDFERPEKGENIFDVIKRTEEFWKELTADESLRGKNILISTHGCAARALLQNLTHDPENYWRGCVPPNCSISMVEVDGDSQKLIFTDRIFATVNKQTGE